MNNSWILIGASRGLGRAFAEIAQSNGDSADLYSRKLNQFDVSREANWSNLVEKIQNSSKQNIVYFAGGGPYGLFQQKRWADHEWALRVNFLFPMFLLHNLLQSEGEHSVRQICIIGSAIAGLKPDPMASSYSAAKHGLVGLLESIQQEKMQYPHKSNIDVRLYSPGYIDTGLLPENAWPRQESGLVKSPEVVAKDLYDWLLQKSCANQHRVFE